MDRTAADLHVHVNTVKHRLSRHRALTGTTLDDPGRRGSLAWAVRVALDAEPASPA